MTRALGQRFQALFRRLGSSADVSAAFGSLRAAYEEPHRHYHDLNHLRDCLAQLDEAPAGNRDRDLAEAALWFHDVVYDPRAPDNEVRSASWAAEALSSAGIGKGSVGEIERLVHLTDHAEPADELPGALVCDVDLSILGRPPREFAEYADRIRAEYHWVPEATYRARRSEILSRLLARDPLYRTDHFRVRYERAARRNLRQALSELDPVGGG